MNARITYRHLYFVKRDKQYFYLRKGRKLHKYHPYDGISLTASDNKKRDAEVKKLDKRIVKFIFNKDKERGVIRSTRPINLPFLITRAVCKDGELNLFAHFCILKNLYSDSSIHDIKHRMGVISTVLECGESTFYRIIQRLIEKGWAWKEGDGSLRLISWKALCKKYNLVCSIKRKKILIKSRGVFLNDLRAICILENQEGIKHEMSKRTSSGVGSKSHPIYREAEEFLNRYKSNTESGKRDYGFMKTGLMNVINSIRINECTNSLSSMARWFGRKSKTSGREALLNLTTSRRWDITMLKNNFQCKVPTDMAAFRAASPPSFMNMGKKYMFVRLPNQWYITPHTNSPLLCS